MLTPGGKLDQNSDTSPLNPPDGVRLKRTSVEEPAAAEIEEGVKLSEKSGVAALLAVLLDPQPIVSTVMTATQISNRYRKQDTA